jgi:hypothetical protein
VLATLANEMRRVGQSYPEPDTADAQAVKARVGQHSVRGCHPALIQNPAKGHARTVQTAVQGSLGDAEVCGNRRRGQTWLTVALPDDVVDAFAQHVVMSFGGRPGIFLSQGQGQQSPQLVDENLRGSGRSIVISGVN